MKAMPESVSRAMREERINVFTHTAGLVCSVAVLLPLINRAVAVGGAWYVLSFSIFGGSLIVLFAASAVYHSAQDPVVRSRLRIVDHASIYILIAGTYTPFTLITLHGSSGWIIFCVAWGLALTGIVLKLFFTGRFTKTSTLMYVFMGWIMLFAIKPLIVNLPSAGLNWLLAGGMAYTLGAVLYSIRRIPFNHAIFHVFVLLGSGCHFMAIYYHV
jgi:hemolysin III